MTFKEMSALSCASRLIPERTAKRWDLISTFVADSTIGDSSDSPVVQIMDGENNSSCRKFDLSVMDCKHAAEVVCKNYPQTLELSEDHFERILSNYPERMALKHIILIPPVKNCYGQPIVIRSRLSFPLVYTTQVAALFSGECRNGC